MAWHNTGCPTSATRVHVGMLLHAAFEVVTRRSPKLDCKAMQGALLLLGIVMILSGKGCRAGILS